MFRHTYGWKQNAIFWGVVIVTIILIVYADKEVSTWIN